MPILTFSCPTCKHPMQFDYADYDFKDWVAGDEDHFEKLDCNGCGRKLKTVPWIAVYDEETEEVVTIV